MKLPLPESFPSFRDFYAFEQHVRNARKRRGLEMAPEWYGAPAFYFSNTASIVAPPSAFSSWHHLSACVFASSSAWGNSAFARLSR